MKFLILLFCVSLSFSSFSQKIYSVYFSLPQPNEVVNKPFFDENVQGIYQKEDNKLVDIVIEEKAVISRYLTPMFLTTTEINTNPKYEFKHNLLYGIDSKKGLEYFIENDTVYFGIFKKDTLFSINDSSFLRKEGINYFLNQKKGIYWETTLLYVKDTTLYLRTIDVVSEEEKAKKFLSLKTTAINKEKIYIASPTTKSFLTFVSEKGFYDIIKYFKQ